MGDRRRSARVVVLDRSDVLVFLFDDRIRASGGRNCNTFLPVVVKRRVGTRGRTRRTLLMMVMLAVVVVGHRLGVVLLLLLLLRRRILERSFDSHRIGRSQLLGGRVQRRICSRTHCRLLLLARIEAVLVGQIAGSVNGGGIGVSDGRCVRSRRSRSQ